MMIISGVLLAYHLHNGIVAAFVMQTDDGQTVLCYVERPSVWHMGFVPYAKVGERYEALATAGNGANAFSVWSVREPGGKFPSVSMALKLLDEYHPALIAVIEQHVGPIVRRHE